ncbi:hypothetical protein B566_EDAN014540 [Ephemera danica]|nr:hypothetical protein B566_EDAN014540 [Ephemera danica]
MQPRPISNYFRRLKMPMPRSLNSRRKLKILTIFGLGTLSFLILVLCICLIDTNNAKLTAAHLRKDSGKLIFVQAVFRHGDRTPGHGYPNDPYKDGTAYAEGWSALTKEGKQRLLSMGRFLRKRYSDFIPDIYFAKDIYTLSSDADRCIMSGQSLLAGLYPPSEIQIIEPELGWQPVPVHTVPRDLDNVVAAKSSCKLYEAELAKTYSSDEVQALNAQYLPLLTKVSSHAGLNVTTVAEAEGLYNTLELQKAYNLTLPAWADENVMAELKKLATISLKLFTHTPYMTRIRGGPLLGKLHTRMLQHENGEMDPKLFLVSGHDLTLINLLRALDMTERQWKPDFAAMLLIEQHATPRGSVVKLGIQ